MRILLSTLFFVSLTACNGVIKNYVGGATPAASQPSTDPQQGAGADMGLKLSPGYMKSTNNGVGMEAHITTTKKVISGGGISAELTMSSSRSR